MNTIAALIPLGILVLVWMAGMIAGRLLTTRQKRRNQSVSTFDAHLLPAPGQSLQDQIEPLHLSSRLKAYQAIGAPLGIGITYFYLYLINPIPMGQTETTIFFLVGLLVIGYIALRYLEARRGYGRTLRQYKAKLATAKALSSVQTEGDFICHEFRRDHLHVDHILVGAKGIFVIQTHPRTIDSSKRVGNTNQVIYDGRSLFFPKGEDNQTPLNSHGSAETLSSWLSDALGEPVASRAIVSMPGWRVKRTSAEGIPVVNPQQFESLFAHIPARPLTSGQIDTIIGLLKAAYGDD
jgi:hypothetical protein